ncbi:hypothetical protein JCM13664_04490 [Methylothermus subterraneus]
MNTGETAFSLPLSEEAAKKAVFDHWEFLQSLARRRFPNDFNTAHLALDYVLENLQEQGWQRVRAWTGQGKLTTFLAVLTTRLMTDYVRKVYGHQRPPKWLSEKPDPIWREAYRVLILERLDRQEAVELLKTRYPEIGTATLYQIAAEVIARSPVRHRYQDYQEVGIEEIAEPGSFELSPEAELEPRPRELGEVLAGYIRGETAAPAEVHALLEKLAPHLHLSDEDRLLLRLRYLEGLPLEQVVKLLHLPGDPYKRLNKLLKSLRAACERAGLV